MPIKVALAGRGGAGAGRGGLLNMSLVVALGFSPSPSGGVGSTSEPSTSMVAWHCRQRTVTTRPATLRRSRSSFKRKRAWQLLQMTAKDMLKKLSQHRSNRPERQSVPSPLPYRFLTAGDDGREVTPTP